MRPVRPADPGIGGNGGRRERGPRGVGGALESGFLVDIDRFQGPLDLLLHLIRKQEFDIFDIPIARITDQFLAAVEGIGAEDLDSAGEFLEMAATLVRIKVQMLLPRPVEDEDEDPRAELVRRLLEYEQIREITSRLERAEAEWARRRGKGYVQDRPRRSLDEAPLETTWEEVFEAALSVSLPEPVDHDHRVSPRTISMEQKTILILGALRDEAGVEFRRLLSPFREKMHGVMTFLAGLELSRRRTIRLRQSAPFRDLWLYRRDDGDSEEGDGDEGARGREDDRHGPAEARDDAPDDDRPGPAEDRGDVPDDDRHGPAEARGDAPDDDRHHPADARGHGREAR